MKKRFVIMNTIFIFVLVSSPYAQEEPRSEGINELLNQIQQYRQNNPGSKTQPTFQQPDPTQKRTPPAAPVRTQINRPANAPRPPASFSGGSTGIPVGVNSDDIVRITKKKDGKRLDVLDLKNMDVQDFLKLISRETGLNIVSGQNVQGRVTIYLKDVDVYDALRIILEANNLAYAEEDNIVKVMTASEFQLRYGFKFGSDVGTAIIKLNHANVLDLATVLNQMKSPSGKVIFDIKSNTLVLADNPDVVKAMKGLIAAVDVPIDSKVFELSYAEAKDLSEKLQEGLTPNVGSLKMDERSNRIVVTDTPAKLKMIEQIIEAFDIKQDEVFIEAKILQVILSDQYEMGVDWEGIVNDYHTLDLTSDFDVLSSSDKRGSLSIGTLANDEYTFLLEALETVGDTNILSNPSITALDNVEAKILVGSTQPYVTTTTTTPSSGPTTTAETVNFIDVGVKLFVTPAIHKDGYVTMKIKPEVSTVTSNLTTSNNNTIPIVETSEAETTVTVKDQVTIVIGGLIKDEEISTHKKVPLLGDIPLLGLAFRSQDSLLRKTELIIFLTPKIITGDVQQAGRLQEMMEDYRNTPRSYPIRATQRKIGNLFD